MTLGSFLNRPSHLNILGANTNQLVSCSFITLTNSGPCKFFKSHTDIHVFFMISEYSTKSSFVKVINSSSLSIEFYFILPQPNHIGESAHKIGQSLTDLYGIGINSIGTQSSVKLFLELSEFSMNRMIFKFSFLSFFAFACNGSPVKSFTLVRLTLSISTHIPILNILVFFEMNRTFIFFRITLNRQSK